MSYFPNYLQNYWYLHSVVLYVQCLLVNVSMPTRYIKVIYIHYMFIYCHIMYMSYIIYSFTYYFMSCFVTDTFLRSAEESLPSDNSGPLHQM